MPVRSGITLNVFSKVSARGRHLNNVYIITCSVQCSLLNAQRPTSFSSVQNVAAQLFCEISVFHQLFYQPQLSFRKHVMSFSYCCHGLFLFFSLPLFPPISSFPIKRASWCSRNISIKHSQLNIAFIIYKWSYDAAAWQWQFLNTMHFLISTSTLNITDTTIRTRLHDVDKRSCTPISSRLYF